MKRDDISDHLVHFIKGDTFEEASGTLQKILRERQLLGGTGYIKGAYTCVCFSEAPVHHLGRALCEPTVHSMRYQPFGILLAKEWLFSQGGRPVIYQSDAEFYGLPESIRWRHVRYEPNADPVIDFSWEREWRILTPALPIDPHVAQIVLPTDDWFDALQSRHDSDQEDEARMYELSIGDAAWAWVKSFPWTAHVLQRISGA